MTRYPCRDDVGVRRPTALRHELPALTASVLLLSGAVQAQTSQPPAVPTDHDPTPPPNAPGQQPANKGQSGSPPPERRRRPVPRRRTPAWEFHGSFFERYRDDRNADNGGKSARSAVTYGVVNGFFHAGASLSLYSRLGFEFVSPGGVGRDFNTAYYTNTRTFDGPFSLDQFGGIYRDRRRGWTITVGRQDSPLDATGTAYDQSWRVGRYSFVDGVLASWKTHGATASGFAFSEDQYRVVDGRGRALRNGIYGFRATTDTGMALTLGGTIARFQASEASRSVGVESANVAEADLTWQITRRWRVETEYGRASVRERNQLLYGLVQYRLRPRDLLTLYGYSVGDNASVGQGSAYPVGYSGFRTFWQHDFDPAARLSLLVYYEQNDQIYGPGKSRSRQVQLSYSF